MEIFVPLEYLKVYINDTFRLEGGEYVFSIGSSCSSIKFIAELEIEGEQFEQSQYDNIYREFLKTSRMDKNTFEQVINRQIPEYQFGKKPYTLETPIGELKGFFGTIFKKATVGVGVKQYKKAKKIKDPLLREREKKAGLFVAKLMPNNCLRSLSFSSGGMVSYSLAQGILLLCNGHPIKGLKEMKKKYPIENEE